MPTKYDTLRADRAIYTQTVSIRSRFLSGIMVYRHVIWAALFVGVYHGLLWAMSNASGWFSYTEAVHGRNRDLLSPIFQPAIQTFLDEEHGDAWLNTLMAVNDLALLQLIACAYYTPKRVEVLCRRLVAGTLVFSAVAVFYDFLRPDSWTSLLPYAKYPSPSGVWYEFEPNIISLPLFAQQLLVVFGVDFCLQRRREGWHRTVFLLAMSMCVWYCAWTIISFGTLHQNGTWVAWPTSLLVYHVRQKLPDQEEEAQPPRVTRPLQVAPTPNPTPALFLAESPSLRLGTPRSAFTVTSDEDEDEDGAEEIDRIPSPDVAEIELVTREREEAIDRIGATLLPPPLKGIDRATLEALISGVEESNMELP